MNTMSQRNMKAASATQVAGPARLLEGERRSLGQVALVFQGGGALGAYQAGVYHALNEGGIDPDWIIGISIGAINACIIAGNAPDNRLPRLREFWRRVKHHPLSALAGATPWFGPYASNAFTIACGVKGFFEPNAFALLGPHVPLGAEYAAYYNTAPLERTLLELVDFDILNNGKTRLTVGAACVRTGAMRYFDSREMPLTVKHIMASGALPPAFPAVRIDGQLYWDGGVLSNTPVERVFDDNPRRSGVVFAVHMWNPQGAEPDTIWKVLSREKDIRYASRAHSHIMRQKQIHKLRHVINELSKLLPNDVRADQAVRELEGYGCSTVLHVVRLLAPTLAGDDHSKDIDFSPGGIRHRWDAGYIDTTRVIIDRPWTRHVDPLEGFVLHEATAGRAIIDS
jgi:NTE family protein